jgi:cell division protein FtsX
MLAFFFWLLTLVLGRTPVPVRDAGVALLRYDLRVYAYTYLLTPAYPKHLLRLPTGGRTLLIILIVLGALGYPATITAEVLTTPLPLTQTVPYRPVLDVMLKQADAPDINDNVVRALHALPHVESVVYNSPEQSYEQAKRVFADDSDLVRTLKPEDFPPLYQVTVDDDSAVAHIEAVAKSLPGVDRVQRIA